MCTSSFSMYSPRGQCFWSSCRNTWRHKASHIAAWWRFLWWSPAGRYPPVPAWLPAPAHSPCVQPYILSHMTCQISLHVKVTTTLGISITFLQYKGMRTYPSPSLHKMSNTSSGCRVKLSSDNFFNSLKQYVYKFYKHNYNSSIIDIQILIACIMIVG